MCFFLYVLSVTPVGVTESFPNRIKLRQTFFVLSCCVREYTLEVSPIQSLGAGIAVYPELFDTAPDTGKIKTND
jgi:hypothetical protein